MICYFTALVPDSRGDIPTVGGTHIERGRLPVLGTEEAAKVVMVQADGHELEELIKLFPYLPAILRPDGNHRRVQRFPLPWAQLIAQNV